MRYSSTSSLTGFTTTWITYLTSTMISTFKLVTFQTKISGKPEDTEAHLLRTNDWMNTNHFREGIKIQRFCLTLIWEARLWYESLEPINICCQGLQSLFRQQYSKIGNTSEQLFRAWWSFHFMKIQKQ